MRDRGDTDEEGRCTCHGGRKWCIRGVPIFLLWVGYLFLGGLVFSVIERPEEIREQERNFQTLKEILEKGCMNDTTLNSTFIEGVARRIVHHTQPFNEYYKWNLVGGIHFCLTVVSTIGYGILAPRTQLGRSMCVVYGVIGIPINLVFMGGIGKLLLRLIDHFYSLLTFIISCTVCRRRPRLEVIDSMTVESTQVVDSRQVGRHGHDTRDDVVVVAADGDANGRDYDGVVSDRDRDGDDEINADANARYGTVVVGAGHSADGIPMVDMRHQSRNVKMDDTKSRSLVEVKSRVMSDNEDSSHNVTVGMANGVDVNPTDVSVVPTISRQLQFPGGKNDAKENQITPQQHNSKKFIQDKLMPQSNNTHLHEQLISESNNAHLHEQRMSQSYIKAHENRLSRSNAVRLLEQRMPQSNDAREQWQRMSRRNDARTYEQRVPQSNGAYNEQMMSRSNDAHVHEHIMSHSNGAYHEQMMSRSNDAYVHEHILSHSNGAYHDQMTSRSNDAHVHEHRMSQNNNAYQQNNLQRMLPKVQHAWGRRRIRHLKAPLWFLTLCVVASITVMSVLFSILFSGGYTFIDGFYYTFVTFSTIGFGDIIPVPKKTPPAVFALMNTLGLLYGMSAVSVAISYITTTDRLKDAMQWFSHLVQQLQCSSNRNHTVSDRGSGNWVEPIEASLW